MTRDEHERERAVEATTLKWVRDRMDMLAFNTPTDQSWESIYKQLRHKISEKSSDQSDPLVRLSEVVEWLDDQCGSARAYAAQRHFAPGDERNAPDPHRKEPL